MSPEEAEEYTQGLGQVVAGAWRHIKLGVQLDVPAALGLSTSQWVEGRLGGYVRMSIPDRREAVKELAEEGFSNRQAAEIIGVDEGTVRGDKRTAENSAVGSDDLGRQGPSAENSAAEEPEEAIIEITEPAEPGWHQLGRALALLRR